MFENTRSVCIKADPRATKFDLGVVSKVIGEVRENHPDDTNTLTSLNNYIAYYLEKERHTPEEFTMDYIVINGIPTRLVYKLKDHGIVECGKDYRIPLKVFSDDLGSGEHYYANGKYRVLNNVDGKGYHRHISANIAGFPIGKPHKLKYDDTYTPTKLIWDKDTQELIKRYFVEKLGACPTAVNFQS